MKKITAALLLTTAVAAAPAAFAADNGYYAGLTLGSATTSAPAAAGVTTKKTDTPYGIVGGYQYNKNLAVEVAYTGAGRYRTATTSVKADALSIAAVGTMPLSDTFGLYGKLGFANVSSKAVGAGTGNVSRTSATYGVGVQYNASQNIGIRFGYDRYGAAVNLNNVKQNYNVNVWGIAAIYKF